jgi:hypothetical protein
MPEHLRTRRETRMQPLTIMSCFVRQEALGFTLVEESDMPFLIREHGARDGRRCVKARMHAQQHDGGACAATLLR